MSATMSVIDHRPRLRRPMAEGVIASYVHHNGRLGVLVEVNCESDALARTDDFAILVRQIAEQIAAAAPLAVSREALPPELVDQRRRAFERDVRATRKPEHLVRHVVDG